MTPCEKILEAAVREKAGMFFRSFLSYYIIITVKYCNTVNTANKDLANNSGWSRFHEIMRGLLLPAEATAVLFSASS